MPNLQTSSSLCSLFLLLFSHPSVSVGVLSSAWRTRCQALLLVDPLSPLRSTLWTNVGPNGLGRLKTTVRNFLSKWMSLFVPNPRQMGLHKADSSRSMPSKSLTAYEFDKSTVKLGHSCASVRANVNFPKVLHLNAICCHILIKTVNMVDLLCFLAPSLTCKKGTKTWQR